MIYVTSDLHGFPLSGFLHLLSLAEFSGKDELIVLGDVIDRNGMFFECVPKGYSKGIGVTKMLQHLNISPEESFAFGDSTNDIEMFRACGTAVAMGKHDPELTAYADYITTDLNDDGIRRAMEHFSLI